MLRYTDEKVKKTKILLIHGSMLLPAASQRVAESGRDGPKSQTRLKPSTYCFRTSPRHVLFTPSYLNCYKLPTLIKPPLLLTAEKRSSFTLLYATFVPSGKHNTCTTSFLPQPPLPPLLTRDHCHRPECTCSVPHPYRNTNVQPSCIRTSYKLIFVLYMKYYYDSVTSSRAAEYLTHYP